jgi:hypothetical protein
MHNHLHTLTLRTYPTLTTVKGALHSCGIRERESLSMIIRTMFLAWPLHRQEEVLEKEKYYLSAMDGRNMPLPVDEEDPPVILNTMYDG